jgi:hypothetical protein
MAEAGLHACSLLLRGEGCQMARYDLPCLLYVGQAAERAFEAASRNRAGSGIIASRTGVTS